MKRTILTTAAFAAVILLASTASAADKTWQPVSDEGQTVWSGDWSDSSHWSGGTVPSATETVELPDGDDEYTVTMSSSASCKELTTHSTAILRVSGAAFALGTADNQSSSIDGTVELTSGSSSLQFGYNHTVSGSGSITGQDNSASITVALSKKLTLSSQSSIEGALEIQAGSATFTNNGAIRANRTSGDSTLACHSGTFEGSGTFEVTQSGATLHFRPGIASMSLTGDFNVSDGTLVIDANVSTGGDWTFTGGMVVVADGVSFKVNQ